ncbi:MAG: alpha/beta hydrolase [Spirochaetia bacterium]|nr:alpha/beta hydrolase [Spirochaetia bacterium]
MNKILYNLAYFFYTFKRYGILKKVLFLQEKKSSVGGIPFSHFESRNSGENLILLHGLLDASFGFRRLIPNLSKRWKLYIPDVPGFGKSKLPLIKFLLHLDIIAQIIYEFISIKDLRNVTLVGHSMGGLLSQHLALLDAKKENRISRLVLISPGNQPHPQRDEIRSILFPRNRKEVLRLIHELYYKDFPDPSPFLQDTLVYEWSLPIYEMLAENTIEREKEIFIGKAVENIKIPTHIIAGENDSITNLRAMKDLHSWIEGSTLDVVPLAKHAIHLEFPEIVAEIINKRGLLNS